MVLLTVHAPPAASFTFPGGSPVHWKATTFSLPNSRFYDCQNANSDLRVYWGASSNVRLYRVELNSSGFDSTLPTMPGTITVGTTTSTTVPLSWGVSTDSGGNLSGYRIFRSSTQFGTYSWASNSATNSYTDIGRACPVGSG